VSVQAEILNLLARLRTQLGLTAILVSHDLPVVAHLCSRTAVMQAGASSKFWMSNGCAGAKPRPPTPAT
jgi:ABC-type dipeptide/oligopeptide/nickel transport system ATPase subunit